MREGWVTHQELYDRWHPLPADWQATILREAGLKPEKYELVPLDALCVYQITRRPELQPEERHADELRDDGWAT